MNMNMEKGGIIMNIKEHIITLHHIRSFLKNKKVLVSLENL